VEKVVVARDSSGYLKAFCAGPWPPCNVWKMSQAHDWSWSLVDNFGAGDPTTIDIAVTPDKSGSLKLFVSAYSQLYVIDKFDTQNLVGTPSHEPVQSVVALVNQEDLLQVFAVQSGSVWTITESTSSQNGWGQWMPLASPSDATISRIAVTRNEDGRLAVFAPDSAGDVTYISEVSVSQMQCFKNLVTHVAPIVYLHPDEEFMPSSFEEYLRLTTYVDENGVNQGPLTEAIVQQPSHGR